MSTPTQEHLRAVLDAAFSCEHYVVHPADPTLQESIMPLVSRVRPDEQDKPDTLCWWGTAFVIGHYGSWVIMATARHVIRDYRAKYPPGSGQVTGQFVLLEPGLDETRPDHVLPIQGGSYLQPTYEADRDQSFDQPMPGEAPEDLAVFAVDWESQDRPLPPLLKLSFKDFSAGERYAAIGYDRVKLQGRDDLPLEERTEMLYERLMATSTGTVREVFPHGRDLSGINFPAFEIGAHYPPGYSGSPIFDSDSFVRAVVSRGLSLDDGDTGPSTSYGCLIAPLTHVVFGDGDITLSVLDLAAGGDVHVREVHGD